MIQKQTRLASGSFQRDPYVSLETHFKQAQHEARVQKHPTRSPHLKDKTRVASSTDETRVFINKGRIFSCQH